jgi:hypothetical protein
VPVGAAAVPVGAAAVPMDAGAVTVGAGAVTVGAGAVTVGTGAATGADVTVGAGAAAATTTTATSELDTTTMAASARIHRDMFAPWQLGRLRIGSFGMKMASGGPRRAAAHHILTRPTLGGNNIPARPTLFTQPLHAFRPATASNRCEAGPRVMARRAVWPSAHNGLRRGGQDCPPRNQSRFQPATLKTLRGGSPHPPRRTEVTVRNAARSPPSPAFPPLDARRARKFPPSLKDRCHDPPGPWHRKQVVHHL